MLFFSCIDFFCELDNEIINVIVLFNVAESDRVNIVPRLNNKLCIFRLKYMATDRNMHRLGPIKITFVVILIDYNLIIT